MIIRAFVLLFPVLGLTGCTALENVSNYQAAQRHEKEILQQDADVKKPRPVNRFVLVDKDKTAFDTQTGMLCRTWDWRKTTADDSPGTEAPLCEQVYRERPSFTGSGK